MHPSTSINLFFDPSFRISAEEQILRCRKGGYTHLDMNFWDWSHSDDSPFTSADWKNWVNRIAGFTADKGIVFTQAHAEVYNFFRCGISCRQETQILRSIEGAGMLGIKWIVLHPSGKGKRLSSSEENSVIDANAEYFTRLASVAKDNNTGLAIENLGSEEEDFNSASMLCKLTEAIDLPNVRVCRDTGHAQVMGQNQSESLTLIGKRLKALHIADNDGENDDHVPPFFGRIDWHEIMTALRQIGYSNDLTFESHNFVRKLPEGLKDDAVALQYRIGQSLIDNNF